jgi:hypothetical protein
MRITEVVVGSISIDGIHEEVSQCGVTLMRSALASIIENANLLGDVFER